MDDSRIKSSVVEFHLEEVSALYLTHVVYDVLVIEEGGLYYRDSTF